MTQAYPLHWPDGWPRTNPASREWSLAGGRRNSQAWNSVVERLTSELRRLGARDIVLSTNQPLRRDGLPYAATRIIDDPGAAIFFTLSDRQMVMAQDRYELLVDNIRSLALAIEGLRQMERHGGAHMMERAFSGFAALPPPGATAAWWEVLRIDRDAGASEIRAAHRELSQAYHPDRGGDTARMAEINAARDAGLQERTHG